MIECFYCMMISLGFCIIFQMKGKDVLWGAAGSGFGWGIYLVFNEVIHSIVIGYFFATILTTVYAELMAINRKKPATLFLIPSIIPFVPGGNVFRAMSGWLDGRQDDFLIQGRYAITAAGAIAMGIIIGVSFTRLVRSIRKYLNE